MPNPSLTTAEVTETHPTPTHQAFTPDSLATGISIMLLLTVGQRLIGFARQVLVCRYLAPEDLGRWNLSFSMIMLLAPLFVLGLPGTFGRYAEYYRHRGQIRRFFRKTLLATVLLTLLGGVSLLLTAQPSAWLIYSDASQTSLILLLVPTLISVIAFNSLVEVMSSLRQVRLVAFMRFGHALLFSLSSLAFIVFYQGATQALIASYAVASVLVCLAVLVPTTAVFRSMTDTPHTRELPLWSKLLPYAGWIWLADLLSNFFAAADRYMMIHLIHGGADQAAAVIGQYHSSRIVPQLFIAVAVLIGMAILPYLSHDWESGDRRKVSHDLQTALKGFAVLTTLGGLLVIFISPWLFGQVMGGKYAEGLAVLPMTLVYCTFFGLFCIAQNYLFCSEKGGYISIALGLGLVANVALNLAFVPLWGLLGGVIATLIANTLSLAGIYWFNHRLGMQLSQGTMAASALPLCFLLGPTHGLIVVLATLYFGIKYQLLFDQHELHAFDTILKSAVQRVPGQRFTKWQASKLTS